MTVAGSTWVEDDCVHSMTLADWFAGQLQTTMDTFLWAVEQLPAELRDLNPPGRPERWSVRRHAFHLVYYERQIALPSLRLWQGGQPVDEGALDEDGAWAAGAPDLEALISHLLEVRAEQLDVVKALGANAWEEPRPALWGTVTPRWIVTKTLQHTAEHAAETLRLALWWGGAPNLRVGQSATF